MHAKSEKKMKNAITKGNESRGRINGIELRKRRGI